MSDLTLRRKIIVADNHADTLSMLELLYQLQGHEVYCTGDGVIAAELAEKHVPDVMLLDIELRNLDGVSLGRKIRADETFKQTALVAHTGMANLTEKAADAGFDYFALKPVEAPILTEAAYLQRQDELVLLSQSLIERAAEIQEKTADLSSRSRIARERSKQIIKKMMADSKRRFPYSF